MKRIVIEASENGQWSATLTGGDLSVKDVASAAQALVLAQKHQVLERKMKAAVAATATPAKEMKNG